MFISILGIWGFFYRGKLFPPDLCTLGRLGLLQTRSGNERLSQSYI